ncbi:DUF1993 family protein [Saccharospirillum salsuginis]|uniref:DUF1993 domain-containing protein n=1 Tax=Saccharospirillum salsuginis TaxID=418750 RepID=A0A918N780_9GAMM|nr:DUF1993 domain-containing protein [Saccharospirillum salsuginis]GGX42893.1 hypothetical protein GCM10007392_06900 [Saccharospirillum salsuginis]
MPNPHHTLARDSAVSVLNRARVLAVKAATHCHRQNLDPVDLLNARLAPDMLNLDRQFQILTSGARGSVIRLAGGSPPTPEAPDYAVFNRGDERDFREPARDFDTIESDLKRALRDLERHSAEPDFDVETRPIDVQWRGRIRRFNAPDFVMRYVIPNLYFHLSMIHALLRHQGVPLGKADFEGPPSYRIVSAIEPTEPHDD